MPSTTQSCRVRAETWVNPDLKPEVSPSKEAVAMDYQATLPGVEGLDLLRRTARETSLTRRDIPTEPAMKDGMSKPTELDSSNRTEPPRLTVPTWGDTLGWLWRQITKPEIATTALGIGVGALVSGGTTLGIVAGALGARLLKASAQTVFALMNKGVSSESSPSDAGIGERDKDGNAFG